MLVSGIFSSLDWRIFRSLQNGFVDPFRFGTFCVQYVLVLVMEVLALIPEPRRTDYIPHNDEDVSVSWCAMFELLS